MGPLIFEPYADDLVQRIAASAPAQVLETAAGTGVLRRVTRFGGALGSHAEITATDLNMPMLEYAKTQLPERSRAQWRQTDALMFPQQE